MGLWQLPTCTLQNVNIQWHKKMLLNGGGGFKNIVREAHAKFLELLTPVIL